MFISSILIIAVIIAIPTMWVAADYLRCDGCNRRKCFLFGHDIVCYPTAEDKINHRTTLICRRCSKNWSVPGGRFYADFTYLSAGYLTRWLISDIQRKAWRYNPFDDFHQDYEGSSL